MWSECCHRASPARLALSLPSVGVAAASRAGLARQCGVSVVCVTERVQLETLNIDIFYLIQVAVICAPKLGTSN